MHIGALPDGRATAPHYDPTLATHNSPSTPLLVETKIGFLGSIRNGAVHRNLFRKYRA
jgi:hypothetical protein